MVDCSNKKVEAGVTEDWCSISYLSPYRNNYAAIASNSGELFIYTVIDLILYSARISLMFIQLILNLQRILLQA
jgi:hypothetical protein